MSAIVQPRRRNTFTLQMGAWLPIALLPAVVLLSCNRWPAWALMWALALSIFAGLKWLTLVSFPAAHRASIWRILGYVFLWPGLNADSFLSVNRKTTLSLQEYVWAAAKTAAGALILLIAAPRALTSHPLAAGWLGMFGLVLILHFGIFHWLSLAWRTLGISAPPLMNYPLAACSLSDFWSRRWNVAFRDVAHRFVLRPLVPSLGAKGATLAAFLFSGLIHDLVISLPVGAGGGRPTMYFILQGIAVLIERSSLGKRVGLGEGWRGRLFAAVVLLLPIGLLFHPPFVLKAILPTLAALGLTS